MIFLITVFILGFITVFKLGFIMGSLHELETSTRESLDGWDRTIKSWKKSIKEIEELDN